jgi:hypothetical protein
VTNLFSGRSVLAIVSDSCSKIFAAVELLPRVDHLVLAKLPHTMTDTQNRSGRSGSDKPAVGGPVTGATTTETRGPCGTVLTGTRAKTGKPAAGTSAPHGRAAPSAPSVTAKPLARSTALPSDGATAAPPVVSAASQPVASTSTSPMQAPSAEGNQIVAAIKLELTKQLE